MQSTPFQPLITSNTPHFHQIVLFYHFKNSHVTKLFISMYYLNYLLTLLLTYKKKYDFYIKFNL